MTQYGYMRVSTDDQTHDLQRSALTAAGILPENIFVDTVSGRTKHRPGLQAMMNTLKAGDTLVVWKLDRLGRSLAHLIHMIENLNDVGVGFQSLTENLDTTTPAGKCMFHVVGAFAQFEREMISQRTKAGMIEAVNKGRRVGRPGISIEQREEIFRAASKPGATIRYVSKLTGINPSTVQRTLDPTFKKKKKMRVQKKPKNKPCPPLPPAYSGEFVY